MGSTKNETAPVPSKPAPKPYGTIVLTLKNCLLPAEKLAITPSQADGLDRDTEMDLRIYGCELIQTAGILLKLPQVSILGNVGLSVERLQDRLMDVVFCGI